MLCALARRVCRPQSLRISQPSRVARPGQCEARLPGEAKFVICDETIEHTFRCFKQTLRWTTPKLRSPAAADRWTWLLILASVPLRWARDAVAEVRLPWQPPLPPERRTPARVRRGFSHVLMHFGAPACAPKPCGRSPGRPTGGRSPPAQRFPAVKLPPLIHALLHLFDLVLAITQVVGRSVWVKMQAEGLHEKVCDLILCATAWLCARRPSPHNAEVHRLFRQSTSTPTLTIALTKS